MNDNEKQNKDGKDKARIVLVDDHPIIRDGLADLIDKENDLWVCGRAEDAHQAIEIVKALKPDIAIVDISLVGRNGMELIRDIKAQFQNLPVLVLSMHDESLYAERALRAGAKGYIMKCEATKNVIVAIRKILSGQYYFSDKMMTVIMHKLGDHESQGSTSPIQSLSDRELEIFSLLGEGHSTHQIADQLHLSMKTIETHRLRIKRKLNIADTHELYRHAFAWVENQA